MKQYKLEVGTTHNLNALSETDAAYLAAFIDGEGSILIYRIHPKDQKRPYYGLRLQATNTHVETMQTLHAKVGAGALYHVKRDGTKWKDALSWTIQGDDAAAVLMQVKSMLLTKRAQAEVGVKFARLKQARRIGGVDNLDQQTALYEEMKRLNARGRKHQRFQIKANFKAQPKKGCQYEGCDQPHYGRGYCRRHYKWVFESKTYDPENRECHQCGASLAKHRPDTKFCSVSCKMKYHRQKGCYTEEPLRVCEVADCTRRHHSGGLCRRHYMQKWHAEQRGEAWSPDIKRHVLRQCKECGSLIPETKRATTAYCGQKCYHRAYRKAHRSMAVHKRTE